MPASPNRRLDLAFRLAGAMALLVLALSEAGSLARQRRASVEAWQARLTAMADDRERALESWLSERRHDLELVASYPSVRALLAGSGEVDSRLREILQSTVDAGSFVSFTLLDATGAPRLQLGTEPLPAALVPLPVASPGPATDAPRSKMIPGPAGEPRVAFHSPVEAEPTPRSDFAPRARLGSIVATVHPDGWLFPLLGREPAPTATGESLLVGGAGPGDEQLRYLSPLRHSPTGSGSTLRPLAGGDGTASVALASATAVGEYVDYRGITTLAATRRLDEAPWGLVVKVDLAEALAPWREVVARRLLGWTSLAAAALLLLWGLRRSRRLRSLQESAERDAKYRLVMEQAGDAILFVRPLDGRILEANRAAERLYGRPAAELRELSIADLRAPIGREQAPADLAAARAGRTVQETFHLDGAGQPFPVEVSIGPAEVVGETVLLEIVRDGRERRAAIERIERLNRILSTTSQINQLIVHERDRDRLLYQACRIFVESAGMRMAWIGRVVGGGDAVPAQLVPAAWAGHERGYLDTAELPLDPDSPGPARRAVLTGQAVTWSEDGGREEPWRRAAEERGYRAGAALPMSRGGQVSGVLVAYSELPDGIRADILAMLAELAADLELAISALESEIALHRAHEVLRGIVEQSPAPIYTLAPSGAVTSWNRAAEEVFGWSAAEVIGELLPIVQPGAETQFRALRDRVLAGEGFRDLEVVRRRRDDSEIVLDLATAPLRDSAGRVTGIVAVATDVTARKRAEEQVRRLATELEDRVRVRTAELEAANRELEAFTYSVSHDLRAPLRAIEGFSGLLEKDHGERLDPEGRRLLGVVRESAQRLGTLLADLLALSRAGRKDLARVRVEMRPLVTAALLELLPDGAGGEVEVVWGPLPEGFGDASLLRQVWINLLSNALKFSAGRERRRIEIGGEVVGSEVRYQVRDNGIGFSPEHAGKLFGVFHRLPGSERFEGNGVGLALVQRVVSRHGGRVWAESTPGEGACFHFALPAAVKV